METLIGLPFAVLECPNIKLKKPSWLHMPSAMTVYAVVIVSYFLITGGIIYDVIVEPPSVGSMTDEHGHQRPVAFLAYRVNGQYIMEGLASSFLFTMGGLGFIILDRSNAPNIPKLNRFLLLFIGFVSVLLSFFMARVFMRMKLPLGVTWIRSHTQYQTLLDSAQPSHNVSFNGNLSTPSHWPT
ncbi:oligosaccharyltransferase complex subunit ostc [Silurus meridionalis]|nr:oligosaccharyltransferase complex subunit ostc [Silurus meridionalis]